MKKRFLAFLLAVCVAVSMLVLPASAVGSNAAVQTATALGGLTAEQAGSLGAPLTRGQAARLLTAFSAYRDTTTAQGRTGRLYSDVDSDSPYAVYIRTAVQNGWMTGYSDGSFRPDNTVTLEEACTMALRLLGYDVAKLGGTFPTAQLSKAGALGLRNEINARQGETLTLEQGTMLFYNALTAMNGSGQVYASTLGFAVSNGQVDISSVLLDNVKGPFVADASTVLPFAPAAIYRNDEVTTSAALSPYDVYYYNESARTVWLYNKRAAGRVTAVSPSASAPTSVTVAGVTYAIASPSVAYQLSSLSGGGVGQVVTLLLGMNDVAVSVLTGDAADAVFYGVVQSSSRTLVLRCSRLSRSCVPTAPPAPSTWIISSISRPASWWRSAWTVTAKASSPSRPARPAAPSAPTAPRWATPRLQTTCRSLIRRRRVWLGQFAPAAYRG